MSEMSDRILGNIINKMSVTAIKLIRISLFDQQINKSQNAIIKPNPCMLGDYIRPNVRALHNTPDWGYNEVENGFVFTGTPGLFTIGFNKMCILHEDKEVITNDVKIRVYFDTDNYWTLKGCKQKVVYLEKDTMFRIQYPAIDNISVPGDFAISPSTVLLLNKI